MCGIGLVVERVDDHQAAVGAAASSCGCGAAADPSALLSALSPRGPDCQGRRCVAASGGRLSLHLLGTLLQVRGGQPSGTPLADAFGNVLLFNGELFGGLDVLADGSDAHTLLQRLARCSSHAAAGPSGDALNVSKTSGASDEDSVPAVLAALRGPWALVYWQQAAQRLWVARDPTGRRSLLVRAAACVWHPLALASVAPEAAGPGAAGAAVTAAAADAAALSLAVAGLERAAAATITAAGAEVGVDSAATPAAEAAAARHDQLWVELEPGIYSADAEALVSLPAAPPAPATELSSSSSDCAAAARSMLRRHAWPGQCAQQHLRRFQRPARLIHDGGELQPGGPPIAASLICSAGHSAAVASALEVAAAGMLQALETAVRVRCDSIGSLALARCRAGADGCRGDGAPLMVLFSGGVDSALLAALAHRCLDPALPIDLVNVCFDAGRSPDRLAALDALAELRAVAPTRRWRLVGVDASLADVDAARGRLLRLLAPACTVMDLNIGAALWLAARGMGTLLWPPPQHGAVPAPAGGSAGNDRKERPGSSSSTVAATPPPSFHSAARVVLLGHGADELCGGYGRHRTRFREGRWQGLAAELALDMRRMWLRNLGRDDRLVADHAREARHPYLDEAYVGAVLAVPLALAADLRLPPGEGDKRLLRGALRALGLPRAAARVKRAIQFGSRLGKLTNARDFGSNRAANNASAGGLRLRDLPAATP